MGEKTFNSETFQESSQNSESGSQAVVSLVVHFRDGARIINLEKGVSVVIGRAPPSDELIRDNTISRQHARFEWTEEGVWIEDLESTNGIHLNGKPSHRLTAIGRAVHCGHGRTLLGHSS